MILLQNTGRELLLPKLNNVQSDNIEEEDKDMNKENYHWGIIIGVVFLLGAIAIWGNGIKKDRIPDNRVHFPIGDMCIAIGPGDDYERHIIENCDCLIHQKKDRILNQVETEEKSVIEFDRTYTYQFDKDNSTSSALVFRMELWERHKRGLFENVSCECVWLLQGKPIGVEPTKMLIRKCDICNRKGMSNE